METLFQDLRYSLRMLRKDPGFTAVAVITLALGTGANTAVFSFVSGTLLRSFAYHDANNLVVLRLSNPTHGWSRNPVSAGDFVELRGQSGSFASLSAFVGTEANLATEGKTVAVPGLRVTTNFFSTLGVMPARGNTFRPSDDEPPSPPVVVISHALWTQHFGGSPDIVGKTVRLNGENYTVSGVMPASFEFPPAYYTGVQFWVPLQLDAANPDRKYHRLLVIGRLKPGKTLGDVQKEIKLIAQRLEQEYPRTNAGCTFVADSLQDFVSARMGPVLMVLMAAVGCVLLMACANVANLQLSRAVSRFREIAVRAALGANRPRLIRQILAESLLISLMAGTLGVLLAYFGVALCLKLYLTDNPGFEAVHVDGLVLLVTLCLTLLAAFIFGTAPALASSRLTLNEGLREGGRISAESSGTQRLRVALVTSECALAVVLLVGAGLLVRTFMAVIHVDPGFDPRNVLTFQLSVVGNRYAEPSMRSTFLGRVLERIDTLPGVEAASVVNSPPLTGYNGFSFVTEENPTPAPNNVPDVSYQVIGPDYFKVLRIPLLRGRCFTPADQHGSLPVVIVSESLAHMYWPGQDPIGRRLRMYQAGKDLPWMTIIAVVGNVHRRGLDAEFAPELFVPYQQYPWMNSPRAFVVRTAEKPLSLGSAIRDAVAEIDADQAVENLNTMEQVVRSSFSDRSFNMALLGVLGGIAFLLAAVGIYGVMSYSVSQRTQEIGVRMALGAQSRNVLWLVLGRGMRLIGVGLVVGTVVAIGVTRFMTRLLFGVTPLDAGTFVLVGLLITAVALLACYIPARRASKVDPLVALRYE